MCLYKYNLGAEPGQERGLETYGEHGQEQVLETRSEAGPDREESVGAEPGSELGLDTDGEHPSCEQVLETESRAKAPDSDSEVESSQAAGKWKHDQRLLESEFSGCESSLSNADTEVCDSPRSDEFGLGDHDLGRASLTFNRSYN